MTVFDPFSEALIVDPSAEYHRLRAEESVFWSAPLQAWVLTRMEDVRAVLKDPAFEAIATADVLSEIANRTHKDYGALIRFLNASLFFKNGAEHQRDRRTVASVLNRIPLSRLQAAVKKFAGELAAPLEARDGFDAVKDFAEPFPQMVMAHIVGLPLKDVPMLSDLLSDLTLIFDPASLNSYDRINRKAIAASDMLVDRIAAAEGDSGLRLIYDAAAGDSEEAKLENAAATALFTLRVGAETTIGLVSLIIRTLVDDQELRSILRQDPKTSARVVAEVIRLQSNVQRSGRVAKQRREIGGKVIQAGERVLLLLGAANRDPAIFSDPDTIALDEARADDVAFGAGVHFCIGASLARLEAEVTLATFLALPAFERAGEETWYTGRTIRRLTSLPVCSVR